MSSGVLLGARRASATGSPHCNSALSRPAPVLSRRRVSSNGACRFLNYQASPFEEEWMERVTAGHMDACAFIRSHDSEYRTWLDGNRVGGISADLVLRPCHYRAATCKG